MRLTYMKHHFALTHSLTCSFLSSLPKSDFDPALCVLLPPFFLFLTTREKKTPRPEPVLKNNGCSGAAGMEINPAPPECASQLVSSNLFLTLSDIWQNFVLRVLESCYSSSVMHCVIMVGMVSVCYSGFNLIRSTGVSVTITPLI